MSLKFPGLPGDVYAGERFNEGTQHARTAVQSRLSQQRPAPWRHKSSVAGAILRSALSLAGSFALKWAVVHARRHSAEEVEGL
ncbi:MAG TPA: hypothetical protein VNQ79_24800 [Blastocatellia bacterium]|nr:hypothetical protein [Blastocatellia bacterium]